MFTQRRRLHPCNACAAFLNVDKCRVTLLDVRDKASPKEQLAKRCVRDTISESLAMRRFAAKRLPTREYVPHEFRRHRQHRIREFIFLISHTDQSLHLCHIFFSILIRCVKKTPQRAFAPM